MQGASTGTTILLQILLTIIGWGVVHWFSRTRDIDKARREMLSRTADDLIKETQEITSAALKYHTQSRDLILENELKMKLDDVSARISLLTEVSQDTTRIGSCRGAVIALKRHISGNHFEDEHLTPLTNNDAQVQNFTYEGLRLRRTLTQFKHSQFNG